MTRRISLLTVSSLAAASALGACARRSDGPAGDPVPFVERVRLDDRADTLVAGAMAEAAITCVADQYDIIGGLSAGDDFLARSSKVDGNGMHHIRLDPTHNGVGVWGADRVVHAASGSFEALNGTLVVQLDGFDTSAEIGEDDAMTAAKADHASETEGEAVELHTRHHRYRCMQRLGCAAHLVGA
ncbi:MAG: hypothetical protein MJE77_00190 [Proteobacteria bacterium]|nr:hypothetical protein [Pseudomonadota bacterium]